jgi:hypothetical protein
MSGHTSNVTRTSAAPATPASRTVSASASPSCNRKSTQSLPPSCLYNESASRHFSFAIMGRPARHLDDSGRSADRNHDCIVDHASRHVQRIFSKIAPTG